MNVAVPALSRGSLAAWFRGAQFVLALAAVVSLALEHGFYTAPVPVAFLRGLQLLAVGVFIAGRFVELATAGKKGAFLRANWFDFAFISGGLAVLIAELEATRQPLLKVGAIYVITMQGFIAVRFVVGVIRFQMFAAKSRLHPARLMAISFLGVILAGTAALSLPKATRPLAADGHYTQGLHYLNCLFTATSATCVTGLVVYDTGHDFTLFGQLVILVLIQVGGMGIMIFGAVFALLAGRQLSLRESLVIQDALSYETVGHVGRAIKFICISTFVIEAIGAAFLWSMWSGREYSFGERLFYSVFHSVSGFCNAGFALPSDSLVRYRLAWQVYCVILPLAVLGGIGFPVLHNVWEVFLGRIRGRASGLGRRFTLHTKLVLASTAVLIVVPAGLLAGFETPSRIRGSTRVLLDERVLAHESPEAMSGMPIGERLLAGLFQSTTTRTVGFNTARLDLEAVSPSSHFLMAMLMFIGGGPASTAGGVKTISIAVLLLGVVATLRRRKHVEVAGRTIPDELVRQASVLLMMMFVLVSTVALVLCYTERTTLAEALFESVSACSTVGLSTGLTARLTVVGRIVIMAAMFAGRLGPLTLMIALVGRSRYARYEYPSERVVIG